MINTCPQLQFDIEQFYYREAKLLDQRKYREWLQLLSESLIYTIPGRYSPERDLSIKEQDAFINLEDELERPYPSSLPIREDNYLSLVFRVERCFKHNAWASNPPPRTRRLVSNIMVDIHGDDYHISSNFILYFSRHRDDNFIYSGERNDILKKDKNGFLLTQREIILDWNTIVAPTLGIFF